MRNARYLVYAFYQFKILHNLPEIQLKLLKACRQLGIKGTILLAEEGINATIAGLKPAMEQFALKIREIEELADLQFKQSDCVFPPFKHLKVKIKPEIVTFKVPLDMDMVGTHLDYAAWDELIQRPEVTVIDTRNDYEITFGTFKGAINPQTVTFAQLPQWVAKHLANKDKKQPIAMFCTGGIRCEKSTAYLKQLGFEQVYHLRGGILGYLQENKNANGLWQGDCFVFDERLALNTSLRSIEEIAN